MKLGESLTLGDLTLKNRIVFAPVVVSGQGNRDGYMTPFHLHHYLERAQGGVGLVILEATCVVPDGRLCPEQLGLWEIGQMPAFGHVADVCHAHGAAVVVQLHHAGLLTHPDTGLPVGPVADPMRPGSRALDESEILTIRDAFIQAALWAQQAGVDGVELHAAHGYLLSQFHNRALNNRADGWGGDLEGRFRLTREIISGIREACGDKFLVQIRLGVDAPTLEDGIELAHACVEAGCDLLNISSSGQECPSAKALGAPADWPYSARSYLAAVLYQALEHAVPIIAVGEFFQADQAESFLSEDHADLIGLARGILADPNWPQEALGGAPIAYPCFQCSNCRYPICPSRKKRQQPFCRAVQM